MNDTSVLTLFDMSSQLSRLVYSVVQFEKHQNKRSLYVCHRCGKKDFSYYNILKRRNTQFTHLCQIHHIFYYIDKK